MTSLMQHQAKALNLMRGRDVFALLMEPGTGKSRVILEDSQRLFSDGAITTLVIIAPAGVDRKWKDEADKWLSKFRFYLWKNSNSQKEKTERENFINTDIADGLKIAAFAVDALNTKAGFKFIESVLIQEKCAFIFDESPRIKNPKALRTKAALKLSNLARIKRILTGTPITQSIADAYAQFAFLNSDILGQKSYFAFKRLYMHESTGYGPGGRQFKRFKGIRNEDDFLRRISPYSFRITKAECLDLPPKVYERHYVELSSVQRRQYNMLRESFIMELESGAQITAEMALTRFGKLQQIASNFIISEDGKTHVIDSETPRIAAMLDIINSHVLGTKFIIWAKFSQEIHDIACALKTAFPDKQTVEYRGANEQRYKNVDSFQHDPDCLFFVANARTAGIGLDLYAASVVIYYSNTVSLEERLQSEDRCHRRGQINKVTYYDLCAVDTVDEKILSALTEKKNLADLISDSLMKNGNKTIF